MKNYLLLLCFLGLFYSCKTYEVLPKKLETITTIKDSTARKVIKRDTVVKVPGDSVKIAVNLDKLTSQPTTKTSKSGRTQVSLSKIGQTIIADCHTEQYEKLIALQETLIEFYRNQLTETKTDTTIVETKMPSWAKWLLWLGFGCFVALVLPVILKIISLAAPLLKKN